MPRLNSFLLPPDSWRPPFTLDGDEAHHLGRVLRARPGEQVRVFDGQGRECLCVIESLSKTRAVLTPVPGSERLTPPPLLDVHLAVGWTRSARRDWLMEKAVELGCGGLHFWQAAHSQGEVPPEAKPAWTARFTAAAKQCGNARLPECRTFPGGVPEMLTSLTGFDRKLFLWEKENEASLPSSADLTRPGRVLAVLGPEGGFAPEEAEMLLAAGCAPTSLGRSILRWETAALTILALLHWAGETLAQP